ncbi:MAG: hypothetical protein ACE5JI_23040, partial [Acidobacteriota bacterium]
EERREEVSGHELAVSLLICLGVAGGWSVGGWVKALAGAAKKEDRESWSWKKLSLTLSIAGVIWFISWQTGVTYQEAGDLVQVLGLVAPITWGVRTGWKMLEGKKERARADQEVDGRGMK